MQQSCLQCQLAFDSTSDDLAFYDKVSPVFNGKKELIPPPRLCPECRMRRRLAWRNERTLHRRQESRTGASILSIHHPDNPYPVYENTYWWSDAFDAKDYGRNFDFSRSFLEQFLELKHVVPMPARTVEETTMQNSDYCNEAGDLKNCYLCFEGVKLEDCQYSRGISNSANCTDCTNCYHCTWCYSCIESQRCYQSIALFDCRTCSDCAFCSECHDCQDCFGSVNLRNKRFHFFNEELPESDYRQRVAEMWRSSSWEGLHQSFLSFKERQIVRAVHQIQAEHCAGDYLLNCRNCSNCYSCADCEDCVNCDGLLGGARNTDCRDVSHFGVGAQLSYECQCIGGNPGGSYHDLFCDSCWPTSELLFCHYCVSGTEHCFGCIGLKKAKYCIFNKQYSKDEYEALVPKIIEHMRRTGEWGEFFPLEASPYCYNETTAQEYLPLTKEEVLARGWRWRDPTDDVRKVDRIIPASQLPESIDDIPDPSSVALAKEDDILNWAIECDATKRPFKIIKQELEFYRQMRLPVPRLHPDERHRRRMALRNPRKLWDRECAKCQQPIATSYSPERPEIVYCERCYLETVY
jgi:hypothetical protein